LKALGAQRWNQRVDCLDGVPPIGPRIHVMAVVNHDDVAG
jgi:hypothetical protein